MLSTSGSQVVLAAFEARRFQLVAPLSATLQPLRILLIAFIYWWAILDLNQ
jgi:hypothetical protein